MKGFIQLVMIGFLCFGVLSCGKRGDLLPPAGYEAPQENNEQK